MGNLLFLLLELRRKMSQSHFSNIAKRAFWFREKACATSVFRRPRIPVENANVSTCVFLHTLPAVSLAAAFPQFNYHRISKSHIRLLYSLCWKRARGRYIRRGFWCKVVGK